MNGSGKVLVRAYAKDATRFAFRFEKGDLQESSTREIEYTFNTEKSSDHACIHGDIHGLYSI